MATRRSGKASTPRALAAVAILLALALVGCDGGTQPSPATANGAKTTDQSSQSATAQDPSSMDPRLNQPFAAATRTEPPADWQRPPDTTMTGKSVGKLYTQIEQLWSTIPLASASGRLLQHKALIETELGTIEIELRPDLAPNHVRNFLALALSNYYDGLCFERTIHAKSVEQPEIEAEIIEGGCPLGTGEVGAGSLGYWLLPEFSKEPHEAGTIGACHGEDPATAACRFYITLKKAPFLDGNFTIFGKVTRGLDVARKIFSLPVRNDPEYPEGDRPEKPVIIQRVTVQSSEQPWTRAE